MANTIVTDGAGHFSAGVVLSLLDYITWRAANPTGDRLSARRSCLESMEAVLDGHASPAQASDNDESSYAAHVETVHDYLVEQGLLKTGLPPWERLKNLWRSVLKRERINTLSNLQKLAFALVVEVFYDSLFGFRFYTEIIKESPIAALSRNLYQVPALWLGLMAGGGLRRAVHWISTSSKEKAMDRTIRDLIEGTSVVRLVLEYEPPDGVETSLRRYATQLTRAGKKAYGKLQSAAEAVTDYGRHLAEKDDREEQEQEDRRQRFEDITRDR